MLAPSNDVRGRLPEIAAPTLVIVGHYDWVCPPAGGPALAAGIRRAELVEVVDAGHLVFSEEGRRIPQRGPQLAAALQPHGAPARTQS